MQRRAVLAAVAAAIPCRAFALYDPKPSQLLALAPGAWTGVLTYRDWSNPDKMVTLPCKLSIALSAPEELALYYVFDDGPGKAVYSYERMTFDFMANSLVWASGISKPSTSQYAVTSASSTADEAELLFERPMESRVDRYTLQLGKATLSLSKVEHSASGTQTFRNRFVLRRGES